MKKRVEITNTSIFIIVAVLVIALIAIFTVQPQSSTGIPTGFASPVIMKGGEQQPECNFQPDGCIQDSQPWYCYNEVALENCQACGCFEDYCTDQNAQGQVYFFSACLEDGSCIEFFTGSEPGVLDCSNNCECDEGYTCNEDYEICEEDGPPAGPFCGDAECNGNETCGNTDIPPECNTDCGSCPEADTGGGGGSSSSSGVSTEEEEELEESMIEDSPDVRIMEMTETQLMLTNTQKGDTVGMRFGQEELVVEFSYISVNAIIIHKSITTPEPVPQTINAWEETTIHTNPAGDEVTLLYTPFPNLGRTEIKIGLRSHSEERITFNTVELSPTQETTEGKLNILLSSAAGFFKEATTQLTREKGAVAYGLVTIIILAVAFLLIQQSLKKLKKKK